MTTQKGREFGRWFGSSVIMDGKGQPLPVYHGTRADFSRFRLGDLGFHFGSAEAASRRLEQRLSHGDAPGAERILPVYLAIKNPLRMPDAGDWSDDNAIVRVLSDMMVADERFADAYELAAEAGGSFRDILERMGYDGVVYDNVAEGGGDSWIAFRPEQIRSVFAVNLAISSKPSRNDDAPTEGPGF